MATNDAIVFLATCVFILNEFRLTKFLQLQIQLRTFEGMNKKRSFLRIYIKGLTIFNFKSNFMLKSEMKFVTENILNKINKNCLRN